MTGNKQVNKTMAFDEMLAILPRIKVCREISEMEMSKEVIWGRDSGATWVSIIKTGNNTVAIDINRNPLESVSIDHLGAVLAEFGFDRNHARFHILSWKEIDPNKEGFVYIVQAHGTSFYKIGVSRDFTRRIPEVALLTPQPLDTIAVYRVTDPVTHEMFIHADYAAFHSHGEWFELTERALEGINDYLNVMGDRVI